MGLPKTGTTFLQDHVFRTCDQIADFGKTSSYKTDRPDVDPVLRMIATASDAEFQSGLSGVKALLIREAEQARAKNPGPSCSLLSYEGFFRPKSIHPVEIFGRLESIFGAVRVLLTIRQQFTSSPHGICTASTAFSTAGRRRSRRGPRGDFGSAAHGLCSTVATTGR
jgi:hypothetical protein